MKVNQKTSMRLYRGIVILSIGLLVLVCILIGTLIAINRYNPKILSLAYRVDASKTGLFFRTDNRKLFLDFIQFISPSIRPAPLPDTNLPAAKSYEFALLKGSRGQPEWVIYAHFENGRHQTLISETDPAIFLKLSEIPKSLARTYFFGSIRGDEKNILWTDLNLKLPQNSWSPLLSVALSPFKAILLSFDGTSTGKLSLLYKNRRPLGFYSGIPHLKTSEAQSMELRLSDPVGTFASLESSMNQADLSLAEGLNGILKSQLEKYVGSTDIKTFLADLFTNGASLSIANESEDHSTFILTGTAKNRAVLDKWIQNLDTEITPGIIRSQRFMKENSRTDIVTRDMAKTELNGKNGWSTKQWGATGSSLQIYLARRDRSFIVSNSSKVIAAAEKNPAFGTSRPGGTLDLKWLGSSIKKTLPFLARDYDKWAVPLSGTGSKVSWSVIPGSQITEINWSRN